MSDETKGIVLVGQGTAVSSHGEMIIVEQDGDIVYWHVARAPAVAAVIMKLAGALDAAALVERLCEALDVYADGCDFECDQSKCTYSKPTCCKTARAVLADAQAWRDRDGK